MLDRYRFDNYSHVKLNKAQEEQRSQVSKIIESGKYLESIDCPICENSNFEQLSEKDRYGFRYSIVICKDCGLIQNNPRLNQDFYNIYYNKYYRTFQGLVVGSSGQKIDVPVSDEEFHGYQMNRGKVIFDFIEKTTKTRIKGKYVVEIGTGTGGILHYFRNQGNIVSGVDLDEKQIAYGKSQGLDMSVGTVKDIKGTPDIVIYSHVFEHILKPIEELQELKKHLSKDSIVYIEVPGVRELKNSYLHDFLNYIGIGHVYYYTLATLKNMMYKSGLSPIHCTEHIQSLSKLGASSEVMNNYHSTMSFLKEMEIRRTEITKHKIQQLLFYYIVNFSIKTHTFKINRKLYRLLKYRRLK